MHGLIAEYIIEKRSTDYEVQEAGDTLCLREEVKNAEEYHVPI